MITVRGVKGLHLKISGAPSLETIKLGRPEHVGSVPFKIPFIKPKLLVSTGDHVKIGTPLFHDKKNQDLKFVSPGCGTISDIVFGPRRVIEKIIIRLDSNEEYEKFDRLNKNDLQTLSKKNLTDLLLQSGMWPLIKELPFRGIADPDTTPAAIWVNLDTCEPFLPAPEVYLAGKKKLFDFGLRALEKLSDKVNISASGNGNYDIPLTHKYSGQYPSGDPGVLLYHTRRSSNENRCWYISGQDLLLISTFLTSGTYPVERIVSVGGCMADSVEKKHCITRTGVPIAHLAPRSSKKQNIRFLAGGLFKGYAVHCDSFLGLYETSLNVIDQGDREEFLGFLRPGFNKPSFSRTFLSSINTKDLEIDSGIHGEIRACVNCGACAKICPVEILPQFTFKCLAANEIEEALEHGLLDCVECGLCSFVCPSKIELNGTFREAKQEYRKEQS
ncbi:MAG: 4Fe-4S dicluster domain-containing protein [Deltaproteobacteria bacterium]|nr:4Fe-4S dicluster domain-containing protein [Deltaproteobacteria bacterium]